MWVVRKKPTSDDKTDMYNLNLADSVQLLKKKSRILITYRYENVEFEYDSPQEAEKSFKSLMCSIRSGTNIDYI